MKKLILILTLLIVMCMGISYAAYRSHQAEQVRKVERLQSITARLERQCKALLPTSAASQLHCVKESLEQYQETNGEQ